MEDLFERIYTLNGRLMMPFNLYKEFIFLYEFLHYYDSIFTENRIFNYQGIDMK